MHIITGSGNTASEFKQNLVENLLFIHQKSLTFSLKCCQRISWSFLRAYCVLYKQRFDLQSDTDPSRAMSFALTLRMTFIQTQWSLYTDTISEERRLLSDKTLLYTCNVLIIKVELRNELTSDFSTVHPHSESIVKWNNIQCCMKVSKCSACTWETVWNIGALTSGMI